MELENNKIQIIGKVISDPKLDHEIYGEKMLRITVSVGRRSGVADNLRVKYSDRLGIELSNGDIAEINGRVSSANIYRNDGSRKLDIYIFANAINHVQALPSETGITHRNSAHLECYLVMEPKYRTTPSGREITELFVAANRNYNKSDYIPVIAWGRNARYAKNLAVGQKIAAEGRLQSREYQKTLSNGNTETRTAYEISTHAIELLDDDETNY